jgi:hypothetical protein
MLVPPAVNPHAKEPVGPIVYVGRDLKDRRRKCTVQADSWFKARALIVAKLGTTDVDITIGQHSKCSGTVLPCESGSNLIERC